MIKKDFAQLIGTCTFCVTFLSTLLGVLKGNYNLAMCFGLLTIAAILFKIYAVAATRLELEERKYSWVPKNYNFPRDETSLPADRY